MPNIVGFIELDSDIKTHLEKLMGEDDTAILLPTASYRVPVRDVIAFAVGAAVAHGVPVALVVLLAFLIVAVAIVVAAPVAVPAACPAVAAPHVVLVG